jgi:hypothetical protein
MVTTGTRTTTGETAMIRIGIIQFHDDNLVTGAGRIGGR